MSRVTIVKTGDDFDAAVTKAIDGVGYQIVAPGDCVLIKPNLVEPRAPDSGVITNPGIIEAVARYCLDHGAGRVIIGEGPSYYQAESQLRECFTHTGVSEIANRLGIEWILFDEHSYRTFRNVSECTPNEFRVTEFAFCCDKLINLPILKTHYLTKVTLAMKNLKGCLKREDKPRFHHPDLSRAVVELCKIVRPSLNLIDATTWKQAGGGLIIASTDIVAADTVGCALMGIDPSKVRTITLGAVAGLGESDLAHIDIIGEELKRLKFKVQLPQEQLQKAFPLLDIVGAERACSGCIIPLLSSLSLLSERGVKLKKPLRIGLGNNPEMPVDKDWLLVGDCTQAESKSEINWVGGCPPKKEELFSNLRRCMTE